MVAIPRSQGIQARPEQVTPTVRQPVDTGQQYIAQGINQLGGAIADIGAIAMIRNNQEQKNYEISKITDFKNQLERFDNQERIKLSELGATPEVIEQSKKDILERRKLFSQELRQSFANDKRLQTLADQEEKDTFKLEFFIDSELSNKKRQYGQNKLYESVDELQKQYAVAGAEDLDLIREQTQSILKDGLNRNLIDQRDIIRINDQFEAERERKIRLQEEMATKAEKLRLNNPWEFLKNYDKEEVPEVYLDDLGNAADMLDKRINFVNAKNNQYNTDLTILNELETQAFVKNLESAPPEQSARYLNALANNITDKQKDLLAQDIFKTNKTVGIAISLADEDPRTASEIIAGNKAINDKVITMPSINEVRNKFLTDAGEAIVQTDFRNAAIEAVNSLYASKAVARNLNQTTIDNSLIEEATKQLFGEIISVNDSKIVGFRKNNGQFVTEDEFEDFFDGLSNERIKAIQGDMPRMANGEILDIEDLKDANLVVVGDGLYTINLYSEFAVDKKGNPFVLNLKDIYNK